MVDNNTFQHLSDQEVQARYDEYKAKGMSEDDIFTAIYAEDCALDHPSPQPQPQSHWQKVVVGHWNNYIEYLKDWANQHSEPENEGMSPACYDEFLENDLDDEEEL